MHKIMMTVMMMVVLMMMLMVHMMMMMMVAIDDKINVTGTRGKNGARQEKSCKT